MLFSSHLVHSTNKTIHFDELSAKVFLKVNYLYIKQILQDIPFTLIFSTQCLLISWCFVDFYWMYEVSFSQTSSQTEEPQV